jgi:hypothetical protein
MYIYIYIYIIYTPNSGFEIAVSVWQREQVRFWREQQANNSEHEGSRGEQLRHRGSMREQWGRSKGAPERAPGEHQESLKRIS